MRAVGVVPHRKELKLLEHPRPALAAPQDVLVRTLDVGICGTDREICTFVYGAPPKGHEYLVLGHEAIGEVIEVGASVKKFKAGDLVVPSVRRPCADPDCPACRADRQDFCFTWKFTERGINQVHGYMTEYFVEEEKHLYLVPPALRDCAVLVEPLTICEKGLAQAWQVQKRLPWELPAQPGKGRGHGRNAVVLGAGPVGILGAMKLKAEGFHTVVYSRSKKPNAKAALVESFGVEYISSEEVTPAQLAEKVGNIDLVYEAVGLARITFDVLEHLGINGVFIMTGIPGPHAPLPVNAAQLMRNIVLKNQAVVGTVNADPQAFRDAIHDLGVFKQRWPAALAKVITARHRLDAHRELLTGKATGIKNVIAFE
ncbi:MAG: glucose 1-dehydrogenase [Verrucomicrobia bacterium]|nr:glucose 1-dehydrogenase [Verrucomicrobiota bacterium]